MRVGGLSRSTLLMTATWLSSFSILLIFSSQSFKGTQFIQWQDSECILYNHIVYNLYKLLFNSFLSPFAFFILYILFLFFFYFSTFLVLF